MDEYRHDGKRLKRVTFSDRITRLEKLHDTTIFLTLLHHIIVIGLIVSQVILYGRYFK